VAWAAVVLRHLDDAGFHEAAVARSRATAARTWADAAAEVGRAVRSVPADARNVTG